MVISGWGHNIGVGEQDVQTILCVRQAQGYIVQHGKYSQHFVNGA